MKREIIKIIQPETVVHVDEYEVYYRNPYAKNSHQGYGFPADVNEKVLVGKLTSCQREWFEDCLNSRWPREFFDLSRNEKLPAVGECECGRQVVLSAHRNNCPCGIDYNHGGRVVRRLQLVRAA